MKFKIATLAILTVLSTACGEAATPDTVLDLDGPTFENGGGKGDSVFDGDTASLWDEIIARCTPPAADEEVVYGNDFHWGYSRDEMAAAYDETYASGKRLLDRAYWDEDTETFVLPSFEAWGGDVTLSRRLVENVTLHIEHAQARGYADFVFFPDMGHSHFFIPEAHWEAEYAGGPVSEISARNTKLLDDPELLVLYHTAEQLQMLDDNDVLLEDRWTQWRFHTRNIVGDNDHMGRIDLITDFDSKANTARDLEGHRYHGAGFNVSASKDGCFPFDKDGEVVWYDLSLSDLPVKTSGDGGVSDF